MNFEFEEDKEFFSDLLSRFGGLDKNIELFDSREPGIKRAEFSKQRKRIFDSLKERIGDVCQLQCHEDCAEKADHVDHLIPLSSNELNKKLRGMKGVNGKKVRTQSFGSNSLKNLILACARCNAFKKHRFPDINILQRALETCNSDE